MWIAGFAVAGVLYIGVAGLSTRIFEVPLSAQFGILQLLPASYWVGIGLIGIANALALRERSDALTLVTGTLLLAAFAVTPNLFEPNARYWDSYVHLSEAEGILALGHLPAANLGQYSANWPGSFLVFAALLATSGMPATVLVVLYPIVSGSLTFVAIFIFLRSTFPRPVAGPGAILGSLFAVWAQFHVSPQSLGFVMGLLVLAIVWRRETRWRGASAFLFGGLVVSHPTTTLILLSILAMVTLFGFARAGKSPGARADARYAGGVTVAYLTIWLAWLFFQATGSSRAAETAIATRIGTLIGLPESTLNLATTRAVENLFPFPPLLRLGCLMVYGIGGFGALYLLRRQEGLRPLARSLFASFIAVAFIGAADILAFGGQFYDRSLLFFAVLLPPLCLTGLRTSRLRNPFRGSILVLLVGASLATASTAYYQEAFNLVPDQSIAVSRFLEQAPAGSVILDGMFPPPIWLDPYTPIPQSRVHFYETYPSDLDSLRSSPATYAVFDPTAQLWYLQWRGINIYRFYSAERTNYSLIYDNGRAVVYYVGS
jgi:hypothetical protein